MAFDNNSARTFGSILSATLLVTNCVNSCGKPLVENNRRMKQRQKRHVLPRDTSDVPRWPVTRENEILIFLVRMPPKKIGILKRG